MIKSNKVYFENLNAIRFIAAFLVIICHIEELKDFFNIDRIFDVSQNRLIGRVGVVLFFVLSGFLITYLLYKEKELTKTISVRKFYIRRILRIWPLYFFIVLFTFFVVPFVDFLIVDGYDKNLLWSDLFTKLFLYVAFLPNLVCAIYGTIPYAAITWSIGAEEQFYLIWPWLNKKVSNKWILMFSIIIGYLLVKRYIYYLPNDLRQVFKIFWDMTLIDCMAIGGIFATLLYQNGRLVNIIRKILFKKFFQWVVLILTIYLVYINFKLKDYYCEIYAILFGVLIINFAANPNRIFSMENKILNYLGKVSYGLYIYHYILIIIVLRLCDNLNITNNFIYYTSSIVLTILVASLSYNFFEKRFIDMKVNYSDVISGENTKL
jgi:peptidoglycan/LPS O-acetylase OafA/YrhL